MHCFKLITFFLICIGVNACVSAPSRVVKESSESYSIVSDKEIIIMSPKVTFELIENDKILSDKKQNIREFSNWINKLTVVELRNIGFKLAHSWEDSIEGSIGLENIAKLRASSDILIRSKPKIPAFDHLKNFCNQNMNKAILIQYLRVKIGNEKEWEVWGLFPLAFGLVPNVKTSSSFLRAVVWDCSNTSILWKNEIFIREMPNIGNSAFENSVKRLYLNLSAKSVKK